MSWGYYLLERVKDAQALRLIEQIGAHYRANISNRFLRPIMLSLAIDKNTWDQIELLTEKVELYQYQGFHLDELYRQIAACARFVEAARSHMIPSLRSRMSGTPAGPDKILREMAAANFGSNLQVFADMLNELYVNLVEMDKQHNPKTPVFCQIPELHTVGRLLVGH